jgi:site-specific DNA-methyltransferase (adenine-specific)
MLRAMRSFLGDNDMMAYLAMMAVRLIELHRVLKPTGSLYLHCDPTASHYLKILLDAVFGAANFRSDIVWKRATAHSDANTKFAAVTDTILFYGKSREAKFNVVRQPLDKDYVEKFYRFTDADGRRYQLDNMAAPEGGGMSAIRKDTGKPNGWYVWKGYEPPSRGWRYSPETMARLDAEGRLYYPEDKTARIRLKRYLDENQGQAVSNVWTDIVALQGGSREGMGYPTQKPVALLERILAASSNEGDVVLDPFCGCGTTVHAAQKMNRGWIGIDITHLAIGLIEKRLREAFPAVQFKTFGVPQDIDGARDMAARGREDKNYYFEFEKWALSLIAAQPGNLSKKGADKGIDGNIYFGPKSEGRAIVSVKAGDNVGVSMIRDLRGVIEREGASVGVFLTLSEPSRPMITEAAGAGQFEMDGFSPVPRIQIVTIAQAMELRDRAVRLPAKFDNFKKAVAEVDTTRQKALDL